MSKKGTLSVKAKNCDFGGMLKENPEIHRKLNEKIVEDTMPYVPVEKGYLRKHVSVWRDNRIVWVSPYAHYQYTGIVYERNIPITKKGVVIGWYSPKDKKKTPTERRLRYHGGGGDHWFEESKAVHMQEWLEYVRDLYMKKKKGND